MSCDSAPAVGERSMFEAESLAGIESAEASAVGIPIFIPHPENRTADKSAHAQARNFITSPFS